MKELTHQSFLKMKNLVILALLINHHFVCTFTRDTTFEQCDFSKLSCTEVKNITIAMMNFWLIKDKILLAIKDFVTNENCFIVNMYLNSEDRVVRLRKGDNIANIIEGNDLEFESRKLVKLINRLHNKKDDEVHMKQTFVLIEYYVAGMIPSHLRRLQDDVRWTIIIVSSIANKEIMEWFPLHRYIHGQD